MMLTQTNQIERMPEKTWSWLKVNTAELNLYATKEKQFKNMTVKAGKEIEIRQDLKGITLQKDASTEFMNKEMQQFIEENNNVCYYIKIPKNHKEKEPIEITLLLDEDNTVLTEDIVIEAEEKSESTIIFKYASKDKGEYYHSGRTRIIVQEGASLKVMKAQLFNDDTKHSDVLGATVEKDGYLSILQAEMGSSGANASWNILLCDEASTADVDVLYVGAQEKKLDFASRIEFQAPKSNSNVRIRGILLGKSKKIFRDTMDFISGSSGSKGREEEEVLMLSKDVRNISVPLLFCGEDDVQGEHAASSGRPNESVLFYLMSRGLSEADAKKLLAESKFSALLDILPKEELREEILTFLRASIEQGGE